MKEYGRRKYGIVHRGIEGSNRGPYDSSGCRKILRLKGELPLWRLSYVALKTKVNEEEQAEMRASQLLSSSAPVQQSDRNDVLEEHGLHGDFI
jgi:hypothetical protein